MSTSRQPIDALAMGLMLLLCMLWGLQQVAMKATAPDMSPLMQVSLRSGIAALLVGALMLWRGERMSLRDGTFWPGVVVGCLFALEYLLVGVGMRLTSASHMVVFLYTAPLFAALGLHWKLPSERLKPLQWLGIAVAFGGIVLAFSGHAGGAQHANADMLLGDALGLLAGLLWALTTVTLRTTRIGSAAPEKQLFYQISVCALAFPLLSLALGEPWNWQLSPFAIGSILVQALVGAFASYLAWVWLLVRYPATKLSVFVFLTPVFAILFGALWLKEPITLGLMGAMALVGAGIVLVNVRRDG